MALSSTSKKRKSKAAFDNGKFMSEEAQARYFDFFLGRNLIAERGLTITPT